MNDPHALSEALPRDRPSIVLIRHGERPPIAPGTTGAQVQLTEKGRQSSLRLAARSLLEHLCSHLGGGPAVHLFVTHDSVLAPFVARLLSRPLRRMEWPRYLDGMALWQVQGGLTVRFRDLSWTLLGDFD